MTALAPTAEATYPGVVEGWRSWRILPFETLDGETSYRLCAAGTRGIPKVWQPLAATVAVCSDFSSDHEAPWPGHECGIYAYGERDAAWQHLQGFLETANGADAVGWAFGPVRLWGRLVECEHGWRAQYAYPGAVTVYAPVEVAEAIRGLYRVDVTVAEPLDADTDAEEPAAAETLAGVAAEVRSGLAELGALASRVDGLLAEIAAVKQQAPAATPVSLAKTEEAEEAEPLPPFDFCEGEAMIGVLSAIAIDYARWPHVRDDLGDAVQLTDVLNACLWSRGMEHYLEKRPGYRANLARLRRQLAALQEQGLLERGSFYSGRVYWRFTKAGRQRVGELALPTAATYWWGRERRQQFALTAGTLERLAERQPWFAEQWEEMREQWIAERRSAQAKGRRAYKAWLRRKRAAPRARSEVLFDDDEVCAALATAMGKTGRPVAFAEMMEELAPGQPTRSEASILCQQLVRLTRSGAVRRSETETGVKRWEPVASEN